MPPIKLADIVCRDCYPKVIMELDEIVLTPAWAPAMLPSSNSDDRNFLVCWPHPSPNAQPGTVQRECQYCGVMVDVAPSSFWLLGIGGPHD